MRPKPRNETKNANKVPINETVTPLPYPITFFFAECDQIIRILYKLSFYSRSHLTTKEKTAMFHNEKDRHALQRKKAATFHNEKRPPRFTTKETAAFHNEKDRCVSQRSGLIRKY